MKIYAFAHKLKEDSIITACMNILNVPEFKIIDSSLYKSEEYLDPNEDIIYVIAFGKIPYLEITQHIETKQLKNINLILLPAQSKLVQSKYNKEYRKEAFAQLNKLKEDIAAYLNTERPVLIKSSDIEDIDNKQLAQIYKQILDDKQNASFVFSNGLRTIEVKAQPTKEENNKTCISFNELLVLKTIKELFNIEKIEIYRKDMEDGK